MKKVWITSLEHNKELVQKIMGVARQYGIDGNGHFWTDDLKTMAWMGPKESIIDKENSLWVLLGSKKDLETDSVRFGLSLLFLSVQARKGFGFPVLFVDTGSDVTTDSLPTALKGADIISVGNANLGAKIVAKANTPVPKIETEYRIDIHANPTFGIWFEIGPAGDTTWSGALLGASGGTVDSHGVGESGKLPLKAVLEYPMKGLKLQAGEKEYTAWAVQNVLDGNQSYYVRVQDMPDSIVFGPYASDDETSAHVINLL